MISNIIRFSLSSKHNLICIFTADFILHFLSFPNTTKNYFNLDLKTLNDG